MIKRDILNVIDRHLSILTFNIIKPRNNYVKFIVENYIVLRGLNFPIKSKSTFKK